jgi:hypothetical protein
MWGRCRIFEVAQTNLTWALAGAATVSRVCPVDHPRFCRQNAQNVLAARRDRC